MNRYNKTIATLSMALALVACNSTHAMSNKTHSILSKVKRGLHWGITGTALATGLFDTYTGNATFDHVPNIEWENQIKVRALLKPINPELAKTMRLKNSPNIKNYSNKTVIGAGKNLFIDEHYLTKINPHTYRKVSELLEEDTRTSAVDIQTLVQKNPDLFAGIRMRANTNAISPQQFYQTVLEYLQAEQAVATSTMQQHAAFVTNDSDKIVNIAQITIPCVTHALAGLLGRRILLPKQIMDATGALITQNPTFTKSALKIAALSYAQRYTNKRSAADVKTDEEILANRLLATKGITAPTNDMIISVVEQTTDKETEQE